MTITDVSETTDWQYQVSFEKRLTTEDKALFENLFLNTWAYTWFDSFTLMLARRIK